LTDGEDWRAPPTATAAGARAVSASTSDDITALLRVVADSLICGQFDATSVCHALGNDSGAQSAAIGSFSSDPNGGDRVLARFTPQKRHSYTNTHQI
jgi:hypothetical protein